MDDTDIFEHLYVLLLSCEPIPIYNTFLFHFLKRSKRENGNIDELYLRKAYMMDVDHFV